MPAPDAGVAAVDRSGGIHVRGLGLAAFIEMILVWLVASMDFRLKSVMRGVVARKLGA